MNAIDPTQGLWFSFHVDNDEFIGFISDESLRIHFHADDRNDRRQWLRAYMKNQWLIDLVARRKFLAGAARPIKLTVADFAGISLQTGERLAPASLHKARPASRGGRRAP
ncbi:DUF1488 family protein [Janthinobacterium sp. 17J80-10]|nr:DUF1488 family protein [Janthinobacterium sp. 17J80-10]